LVGALVLSVIAMGCTQDPVVTSSATCDRGSATVVVFQGPSGRCLPRERLVEYRCAGSPPLLVVDAGSARERRYLGGAFATKIGQLPEKSQVLGVGNGTQAVVVPDQEGMYTVHGPDVFRWLTLPAAGSVEPGGPEAFMLGDSLLFGGQFAITEALPGWTLTYDGENGRGSASGVAIAGANGASGHDVVVVELGTNDRSVEAFRENARSILGSLRSVPLVLWQTVKGPEDVVPADEINAAIRQLIAARPQVALADWAGLVKDEELGFDGVHPLAGFEDAMARLLSPMLTGWWSAVTADRVRCG
jgi:hypothetical protein